MTTSLSKAKRPAAARAVAGKPTKTVPGAAKDAHLLVRLDQDDKALVQRAAAVRELSLSDYVRSRMVPLARQDIAESDTGVLSLPREDQIVFWQALQHPPAINPAQRELGDLVRSVM